MWLSSDCACVDHLAYGLRLNLLFSRALPPFLQALLLCNSATGFVARGGPYCVREARCDGVSGGMLDGAMLMLSNCSAAVQIRD